MLKRTGIIAIILYLGFMTWKSKLSNQSGF